MPTRTIRRQIDATWNAFWTGGISNPLEVIAQITGKLKSETMVEKPVPTK
jgi:hypothetical protein